MTKNSFFRKASMISALVVIVIAAGILAGCQKEEIVNDMPYLEISSDISNLTESDIKILGLAKERIEKYVNSENGIFELTVNSAKQINVSEELFEYFKNTIKQANLLVQKEGYVISGSRLIKKDRLIPRLKSGNENGSSYNSGIELTWYGMAIHISHSDVSHFANENGIVAILSGFSNTGIPQYDAALKSLSFVTSIVGLTASAYDNGNGFTIICPLYVPSYIQVH